MRNSVIAPINFLGQGIVGMNIVKSMIRQDVDFDLYAGGMIQMDYHDDPDGYNLLNSKVKKTESNPYNSPERYDVSLFERPINARICYYTYEADIIPFEYLYLLSRCNRVIVPTEFLAEILRKNQVDEHSIRIMPLGVDTEFYSPADKNEARFRFESDYRTKLSQFVMVSVGKYEFRKNQEAILDAMCLLSDYINATLIASWDNPFRFREFHELREEVYKRIKDKGFKEESFIEFKRKGSNIVLVPGYKSCRRMAQIYQCANFGIFPHRLEGFCLPIFECMSCGTPVMWTGYSGCTEYIQGFYSPFEYTVERSKTDIFPEGSSCANVKSESIISTIEECASITSEQYNEMSASSRERMLDFTWDKTSKKLVSIMREDL